jgi:biotin carboxyl carrier protein
MAGRITVTQIASGQYRVERDGQTAVVYVATSGDSTWAFWNGRVFVDLAVAQPSSPTRARPRTGGSLALTAPMPATVLKVLVAPGAPVKKGDTVILLEAMKMELPIRAPADAVVRAIHCREGELVQPETTLVDLE